MLHQHNECFPEIHNIISFTTHNLKTKEVRYAKEHILEKLYNAKKLYNLQEKKIINTTLKAIPKGSTILAIGINSIVKQAIISAKKKGVNVLMLGHHSLNTSSSVTLLSLHKEKVKPVCYPYSLAYHAVKRADMVLTGAIAATPESVITVQGVDGITAMAFAHNIPVFAVLNSWKFTEKNHLQNKGSKTTPLFSVLNKARVISDLGLFDHHRFVEEVYHKNAWHL
jgi:translation initiation factor 2B subunit (eIF-2B alpha/beta/delta family)